MLNLSAQLNQLVLRSNHEFLLALDGDTHFDVDLSGSMAEFKEVVAKLLKLQKDPEIEIILREYIKYSETALIVGRKALAAPTEVQLEISMLRQLSENITHRIGIYHDRKRHAFDQAIHKISNTTIVFKQIFTAQSLVLPLVFLVFMALILNVLVSIELLVSKTKDIGEGMLDQKITIDRRDELGSLQSAFEKMRCSLRNQIKQLDDKVRERTHSLNLTQNELRELLNTIEEAIFTFNLDGSLNNEHSRQVESLFSDRLSSSKTVMDLFQLSVEQQQEFERWLKLMASPLGINQWDKYVKLCPILSLQTGESENIRHLKIRYKPIIHQNLPLKVMVLALDMSWQIEAEQILSSTRLEQAREIERILGIVGQGCQETDAFLLRFEQCLALQRTGLDGRQPLTNLMQQLHTLRGNCGIFGFDHLAECLFKAENHLKDDRAGLLNRERMEIWVELEKEKLKLLTLRNRIYQGEIGSIAIDEDHYKRLIFDFRNGDLSLPNGGVDKDRLLERIQNLDAIKLSVFARRFEKLLDRLAGQHHKSLQPFAVENGELFLNRRLCSKIEPLIVHLLRNAIVHGIEDDRERKALGKDLGKLTLRVLKTQDHVAFEVEDDGRGIDIEAIRKKHIDSALIDQATAVNMGESDWIEKIFDAGFSVKNEVTPDSGRGLGLSAVREELRQMGGQISLKQQFNKGCIFRIQIPVNFEA